MCALCAVHLCELCIYENKIHTWMRIDSVYIFRARLPRNTHRLNLHKNYESHTSSLFHDVVAFACMSRILYFTPPTTTIIINVFAALFRKYVSLRSSQRLKFISRPLSFFFPTWHSSWNKMTYFIIFIVYHIDFDSHLRCRFLVCIVKCLRWNKKQFSSST